MALPKSTISGRFPIPDDSVLPGAYVLLQISGFDTAYADVVAPAPVRVNLDDDGAATFELFQNTAGLRGTYYTVAVRYSTDDGTPGSLRGVNLPLANIQVGDAATYDLADLLNTPVPDFPGWNVNLNPTLYAELLADIAATAVARDEAEAARDEVAANLANLLFVVAEDDIGVTLAIGAAVLIGETDDPYPSITLEFMA